MGLQIDGIVLSVKQEKSDKGRYYKTIELLSMAGGKHRVETVTDMANGEGYIVGRPVSIEVALRVWQGKSGVGYGFTHWGEGEDLAAGDPPAKADQGASPGGAAKVGNGGSASTPGLK